MDPGSIGALIPIAAIAAWGAVKIARIKAEVLATGADPQLIRRLEAVENDLSAVRQELSETQERLDFTERMLAQQRSERLEPPK